MTDPFKHDARVPGHAEDRAVAARRALVETLLVAGEDASPIDGALHLSQLLARRDRINVHVLTVVRPLAVPASLFSVVERETLEHARRQRQLASVRQRVHQCVGLSHNFDVSAEVGSPAPVIARIARERRAELILVGIEAHGAPGRAQTEDAALQLTRTGDVPVVAVPPNVSLLPRRALVAMDFSEASIRAARAALLVLAGGGSLTLAHVAPDVDFRELGKEGWGQIYDRGVADLFDQLAGELRTAGDVEIDTVVMRGDASVQLLDLAVRGAFELIAAGSQSAPWIEWHLTGSVSTNLLRGARCAVLIAPPTDAAR
jgi:nucleotide-binding universal stress UspA family protein